MRTILVSLIHWLKILVFVKNNSPQTYRFDKNLKKKSKTAKIQRSVADKDGKNLFDLN